MLGVDASFLSEPYDSGIITAIVIIAIKVMVNDTNTFLKLFIVFHPFFHIIVPFIVIFVKIALLWARFTNEMNPANHFSFVHSFHFSYSVVS